MNTPLRATPEPPNALHPEGHRILIVDDHPIVRTGVSRLINAKQDLEVCGTAEDGPSALPMIDLLRPDLILLDITLKEEDGLDLLREIKTRWPEQRVLMLSMHDDMLFAPRSLRLGALGYVNKQESPETLITAIRTVLRNEIYLSPRFARILLRGAGCRPKTGIDPLENLSGRELEVLRMIGEGKSTRVIAEELQISVKTVETYRGNLKDKLHLKNGSALVHHAFELSGDRALAVATSGA
jgi:DNA-binding NarL/FixJ family response regulator